MRFKVGWEAANRGCYLRRSGCVITFFKRTNRIEWALTYLGFCLIWILSSNPSKLVMAQCLVLAWVIIWELSSIELFLAKKPIFELFHSFKKYGSCSFSLLRMSWCDENFRPSTLVNENECLWCGLRKKAATKIETAKSGRSRFHRVSSCAYNPCRRRKTDGSWCLFLCVQMGVDGF